MIQYSKILLIIFLCVSLFLTGCYSYFPVAKEDLQNFESGKVYKIVLKNNDMLIAKDIRFSDPEKIIIIQSDSIEKVYSLSEIEKISEEKFDFGKTFFSSMWITFGAAAVLLIINFISSDGKGLSVG